MKVQDVMNMSAVTCAANDTLATVAQKLWEHDCGCLPVADREGRPVAMITDRDVCMAAYTSGRPLGELRVANSMSKTTITCRGQEDIGAAAQRMAKHGVRRLPVVDPNGKLIGILSLNDLATASAEAVHQRIPDIAAAEALRVLTAVSRHRTEVPAQPASAAAPTPAPAPARPKPALGEARA